MVQLFIFLGVSSVIVLVVLHLDLLTVLCTRVECELFPSFESRPSRRHLCLQRRCLSCTRLLWVLLQGRLTLMALPHFSNRLAWLTPTDLAPLSFISAQECELERLCHGREHNQAQGFLR